MPAAERALSTYEGHERTHFPFFQILYLQALETFLMCPAKKAVTVTGTTKKTKITAHTRVCMYIYIDVYLF